MIWFHPTLMRWRFNRITIFRYSVDKRRYTMAKLARTAPVTIQQFVGAVIVGIMQLMNNTESPCLNCWYSRSAFDAAWASARSPRFCLANLCANCKLSTSWSIPWRWQSCDVARLNERDLACLYVIIFMKYQVVESKHAWSRSEVVSRTRGYICTQSLKLGPSSSPVL